MVKAVAALWDAYGSFREASIDVLTLSAEQLRALESLTRESFDIDASRTAAALNLSEFEAQAVLRVVSSLYNAARVEDLSGREVVDALVGLALPDEDRGVEALGEEETRVLASILQRREAVDLTRARRMVEGALLPVLDTIEMGVDLRVNQDPEGDPSFTLVPVAVARLVFDEAVAGGSNVVHFQMPPRILEGLHTRVREIKDRLDALSSSDLADWLM